MVYFNYILASIYGKLVGEKKTSPIIQIRHGNANSIKFRNLKQPEARNIPYNKTLEPPKKNLLLSIIPGCLLDIIPI